VVVYIGASSPLLSYSPMRNGAEGTSWVQDNSGDSRCSGTGTYAVELDAIYCERLVSIINDKLT